MKKLYFSISETSGLIDEEQHVLRYWEKEFPILKPKKNRSGNRTYSEKDLIILRTIKRLIRDEMLNVKDANNIILEEIAKTENEINSAEITSPTNEVIDKKEAKTSTKAVKTEKKSEKIDEVIVEKENNDDIEVIKEQDAPEIAKIESHKIADDSSIPKEEIKSFLLELLNKVKKL